MQWKSQICYSRHENECERERMKERLRLLDLHALVTSLGTPLNQSMCEAGVHLSHALSDVRTDRILRDCRRIV